MAYVGKVSITSEWAKLEDLIKAQVDGQSAFAFDTSKTYTIQTDGPSTPFGARFCNTASTPENDDDGEYLTDTFVGALYQPESGAYLYVRTRGNTTNIKVSVSENA